MRPETGSTSDIGAAGVAPLPASAGPVYLPDHSQPATAFRDTVENHHAKA
jgi:hypothetical protein